MQKILARNKIFAHPDRIKERIKNWITKPITIEIDLTNKCNHNCPFCAGNKLLLDAELSLDSMICIINQLKTFVKWIIFTWGGEPFMNHNIMEAVIHAKKVWIDVWIITNG